MNPPKIPKKYQPPGFEILHEDPDLIVGCKAAGFLTVAALFDKTNTVHHALNVYVRKGAAKSKKCVYVVHRLDQATSGVLIFAKTPEVQNYLKDNWKSTVKFYYAIVHGHLAKKTGRIESYLQEDEDYVVHSNTTGKLAVTEYEVMKEIPNYSLVKVNLLTGRKNQIRVHMADLGHPIAGDSKYGQGSARPDRLMLHSYSIEITHPFSKKRVKFQAEAPAYFRKMLPYDYTS